LLDLLRIGVAVMYRWASCDCCGRSTNRLHHGFTCGTEYSACDECAQYDWYGYGEEPAEYRDETPKQNQHRRQPSEPGKAGAPNPREAQRGVPDLITRLGGAQ
jgi:ribosome-binding protein aMBF1 (putative translation factor)